MELLWNETCCLEWEQLADLALAPLQQRWCYGETAAALGGNVERLVVRKNGVPVALAQFLTRRIVLPVTLTSRGPVWLGEPEPDTRAHILAALRRSVRGPVLVTPEVTDQETMGAAGYTDILTPATIASLPINGSPRTALKAKRRNRLVAAEGSGLFVKRLPARTDSLAWLLKADRLQQKVKRFRSLPSSFTAQWLSADSESVLALAAFARESDPVAAMLFLRHGRTATYHIGWSGPVGRTRSAHNLLLWNAMTQLAASGVERLDLGALDTETAPGLARFKLGTGARPHRLGGTWIGW